MAAGAVLALVAVAAVPVDQAQAAGIELRAKYDFTQGHARDLSGNGHDGAVGTGVTFLPVGAQFEGSDDGEITIPYDSALQPEDIEPGERWRLELDDVVPQDVRGTHRAIVGGRAADDGWVLYITPTGTIEFWVAQASGSARYARASSRVVAQVGRSYDVAVEWDGQVASIEVSDGGTGSGGTTLSGGYLPAAEGHPVRFGNGGNTGAEFFYRGTIGGAQLSVLPVEPQPTAEEVCGPGPSANAAPVDWNAFTSGAPDDEVSRDLADVSLNATRYSLTTWYPARYTTQPHRYLDFGGTGEQQIRGPAMVAVGTAVPLALGTYDASAVGLSEDDAAERVARLAASLAYQHRANSAGGWGGATTHWQTPLWSFYAGMAGWLVWEHLTPAEQACVENMLQYEAERIPEPAYYRDADGNIISDGNTQAEEDSAWASLLGLATAMMPGHESWQQWQQKNVEMLIAAYSRPADTGSAEELNGRVLSEVLGGSNIENDGTVVNHGFLHPIYMLAFDQSVNTALTSSLAGQATPEAALHNIDVVYDALVDLDFSTPPYREPGGTIYRPGSADVYYPQGNDWGTSFPLYFAQADVIADSLEQDGLVRTDAATWAGLHTDEALAMQERHADGRTYANSTESNYALREERITQIAGLSYLTRWLDAQDAVRLTSRPYSTAEVDPVLGQLERPRASAAALVARATELEADGTLATEQADRLRAAGTKLDRELDDLASAHRDGDEQRLVRTVEKALATTTTAARWLEQQTASRALAAGTATELRMLLDSATESLTTLHGWTANDVTVRLVHGGNHAGPGTVTEASLVIENDGPTTVEIAEVGLDAPHAWSVVREDSAPSSVAPGQSAAATFTVVAPPEGEFTWDWSLTGTVNYRVRGAGEVVLTADAPILPEQRR